MKHIIIDSQNADLPTVEVSEGEIIQMWRGDDVPAQEMRVVKLYPYHQFGIYAMLESTTNSFGFSIPVSSMRLLGEK